jgi:hypothetical protein
MTIHPDEKTVRVPIRVVGGKIEYLRGGSLPTLCDATFGELVLPASAIKLPAVREKLLAESVVPLVEASAHLLVRISSKSIPHPLSRHVRNVRLEKLGQTMCVDITLRETLSIRWRGSKLAALEPVKCNIPALPGKDAESLNHAYRLVSEAFEPHRRSHSANVFHEIFVQRGTGWLPLEALRSEAEEGFEASLVLGDER